MRVVEFHRRLRSHLFYTLCIFSQGQTRVKLHKRFMLWALIFCASLRMGLARSLNTMSVDTLPCVTIAQYTWARHGITIRYAYLVGLPVPGYLADYNPQVC